jgi:hypothetical protein
MLPKLPTSGDSGACSSSWVGVGATHRGHRPYLVARTFDPHRPYQL